MHAGACTVTGLSRKKRATPASPATGVGQRQNAQRSCPRGRLPLWRGWRPLVGHMWSYVPRSDSDAPEVRLPRCPPVDVRVLFIWRRNGGRTSCAEATMRPGWGVLCRELRSGVEDAENRKLLGTVGSSRVEKGLNKAQWRVGRRKIGERTARNFRSMVALTKWWVLSARKMRCSRGGREAPVGVRKRNAKIVRVGGRCRYREGKKNGRSRPPSGNCAQRPQSREPRARVAGKGSQQLHKGNERLYNDAQDLCGAACL